MRLVFTVLLISVIFSSHLSAAEKEKKRRFRHDGEIRGTFLDKDDTTNVALIPMAVPSDHILMASFDPKVEAVLIMAGFNHRGRILTASVDGFEFYIIVQSATGQRIHDELALTATLDGERVTLGPMRIVDSRPWGGYGRATLRQTLFLPLAAPQVERIVSAKKVQLDVSEVRFRLASTHMEALRDLADRATPPQ